MMNFILGFLLLAFLFVVTSGAILFYNAIKHDSSKHDSSKHVEKHLFYLLKIACIVPLEMIMEASAFIVVPFVVPFAYFDDEDGLWRLPRWARWYDDFKYGVDGDPYWIEHHAKGNQQQYIWRVKWLWRNKTNTFSHEVLGVDMTTKYHLTHIGDPNIDNRVSFDGDKYVGGKSGFLFIEANLHGKTYPCYYFIHQWGDSGKCFRIYWGWKFKEYLNKGEGRDLCMFTTASNPLMTFVK